MGVELLARAMCDEIGIQQKDILKIIEKPMAGFGPLWEIMEDFEVSTKDGFSGIEKHIIMGRVDIPVFGEYPIITMEFRGSAAYIIRGFIGNDLFYKIIDGSSKINKCQKETIKMGFIYYAIIARIPGGGFKRIVSNTDEFLKVLKRIECGDIYIMGNNIVERTTNIGNKHGLRIQRGNVSLDSNRPLIRKR